MGNEFEANLGDIRREKGFYESSYKQNYQRPKEESYIPQEPSNTKEIFILFFVIVSILAVFVMFGIFLNQVSKDKFKSTNSNDVKLEPQIDVYSNTTNNYSFQTPIQNFYNQTIIINNYINISGGNQS